MNSIKPMLIIFKNKYFFFQSYKNKHQKGKAGKAKRAKVVIFKT